MKLQLILLFIFTLNFAIFCQNTILYNLDSYKRVDGKYRTTFITPDANLNFGNILNSPNLMKNYNISVGGKYMDNQIRNDKNNQNNTFKKVDFGLLTGSNKDVSFIFEYDYDNRSYNDDLKYFKNGVNITTNNVYEESEIILFKRYLISANVSYDLGFGFGRLEIINNAWLGARILEELESKKLLTNIPSANEMKAFFDLIGDLEFDRVMDNRLRSIYRIEKMIEFIEQEEWIDRGSIPAFVTIYDAFLFENFIFRQSGERLEFTLTPTVSTDFSWLLNFNNDSFSKSIRPGFNGNVEYEIHENGDLNYYTIKLVGGRIEYFERFEGGESENTKSIAGNVYFEYKYRYLPSLRTNLLVVANASAGFIYSESYSASLSVNTVFEYNYYFSPATRLAIMARITYNDRSFQIGDYQPNINTNLSVNVVHAIR